MDISTIDSRDGVRSPDSADAVHYAPVSVSKFVVLSILTFGLYEIVWFYRTWRWVKRAEGVSISPWARTLFAPVFYYSLLKRLDVRGPVGLAIAYFFLVGLWRLPDPYWLLSSFSFLPLLPAVQAINGCNPAPATEPAYTWRKRSVVVAILGLIVVPFAVMGTFGPPAAVVGGEDMRETDLEFLEESGLLLEGEEVLFFYSTGFLSSRSTGVFASNLGVTSYWTDPMSDELEVAFLRYEDIQEIEVQYASHLFEDTVVRVWGPEQAWFLFFLSAEGGGDRRFLEEVERRRGLTRPRNTSA